MSTSNGMEGDTRRSAPQWPYSTDAPATAEAHVGHEPAREDGGHGGHGGHGLMMIICCIPMLAIAGLLVLTGVAGSGVIVSALLCTAMMAAMHGGHGGGHSHK